MPAPRAERWLARRIPAARQVRLGRRQVFILPSRAGLALGAALVPMLLVAINYQNSLAYALVFLLVSLALVSMLHTWRNLVGVALRAVSAEAVHAGRPACFRVLLDADGPRPAIALGWARDRRVDVDIPASGQAGAELLLPAPRRGWLRAPRLRVESRYPLGLWVAWSWVDLEQRVLVYPRPADGPPPISHDGGDDAPGRPAGEGMDDFRGLRQYQNADGLRRLDWKAYARGQGLRVKDFRALAGGECLLDLERMHGSLEERLSWLCQGVLTLTEAGRPFELRLGGLRLGPAAGHVHRDACLRALALYGLGDAP